MKKNFIFFLSYILGGYDGYRPSFSTNTPNSGYTQSQFSAPRDYSGYQRVGEIV